MVQSWLNADSLYTKFGTDRATSTVGGEYRTNTNSRVVEFTIDLTTLTETETPLSDSVFLPAGARIQEVDVITKTLAATGTAIDLGLIKTDRATEIDYNGLLAAFPTANMDAAGETTNSVVGSTYIGALCGTSLAFTGYVTCSRTTATAFTAGVVVVQIKYFIP